MTKYLTSRIALLRSGKSLEISSDEFLPDYVSILQLARDLLEKDGVEDFLAKAVFIFDDCLVAGLFMVATICRERKLRRQAIDLLDRRPRREGL